MTYTQSDKSTQTSNGKSPCGCGCSDHGHKHDAGCCHMVCFERPNYFCGHLLSDADLTLEQNYLREKNKLYHRTIDGNGVVCGLRLTCDPRCEGHIRISDGYAIDCCGNDLVLCEPRSIPVMDELRKKQWVLESPQDPCQKTPPEDCTGKQCFYVGICYEETKAEFITPFQTDCSPGPSACQPTRIKEGVRFELYQDPPVRPNPLHEIEKGIERCFHVFREGQFSKGLQRFAPDVLSILDANTQTRSDRVADPHDTFCAIRALFIHQLRVCPDQYNCTLDQDVWKLPCPPKRGTQDPAGTPGNAPPANNPPPANVAGTPPTQTTPPAPEYGGTSTTAIDPEESFKSLFELIQKYVLSCVLSELAFLCPQPADACCVLIGSVEVEHGRITRVLNWPRWYLWCFANFFEVLVYTLANEAACGHAGNPYLLRDSEVPTRLNEGCCPAFEVNVREFLGLFTAKKRGFELGALASVEAIKAVHQALVEGFDFIKPGGVAPQAFRHMPLRTAEKLANTFQFDLETLGEAAPDHPDPVSALLSRLIHRGHRKLFVFDENKKEKEGPSDARVVTEATRSFDTPARGAGFSNLTESVSELQGRVTRLEPVSDLEARVIQLEAAVRALGMVGQPGGTGTVGSSTEGTATPASGGATPPASSPVPSPAEGPSTPGGSGRVEPSSPPPPSTGGAAPGVPSSPEALSSPAAPGTAESSSVPSAGPATGTPAVPSPGETPSTHPSPEPSPTASSTPAPSGSTEANPAPPSAPDEPPAGGSQ